MIQLLDKRLNPKEAQRLRKLLDEADKTDG
jgi:hypothetical protein